MKKALLALVILVVLSGLAFGQEAKKPTAAVSLELFGSIIAPMGLGVEFFLGPVGIGAELRGLFFGTGDMLIGTLEPGLAARFYFGDLDSALFLMGGVSYVTAWAFSSGETGTADFGFLKPKAAIGYNALFGKDSRTRFAIELGAVYMQPVFEGTALDWDVTWPILPHFLIMFGRAF